MSSTPSPFLVINTRNNGFAASIARARLLLLFIGNESPSVGSVYHIKKLISCPCDKSCFLASILRNSSYAISSFFFIEKRIMSASNCKNKFINIIFYFQW